MKCGKKMEKYHNNNNTFLYLKNRCFLSLTIVFLIFTVSIGNLQISFSLKLEAKSNATSNDKLNLNEKSNDNSEFKANSKNELSEQYSSLEKNKETTNSNSKQYPLDPCPCASLLPACCTPEFESFICDCIMKPDCGICPVENLNVFSNFHDSMLKMAMKDAFNQQDLAQKAKLQVELFQKAQDFAKEVGIQEMKAKQYARILNEATRKAQIARAMMFQAASQVRLLADKTLRAITPMRCTGSRCGVGSFSPGAPNFAQVQPLLHIKQKIDNLGDLTNPVMSTYGSFGRGDYSGMKDGYFRNSSYNGNSRESAYSGENSYGVNAS